MTGRSYQFPLPGALFPAEMLFVGGARQPNQTPLFPSYQWGPVISVTDLVPRV
jgi:hypothetical protein